MESIYRFVSFESFVDIIQRKSLAFVSPSKWEDPYESFIFKAIRTDEGHMKVVEMLKELGQDTHIAIFDNFEHIVKGQCWTKLPESDALWRIYSYDNMAVRIEVDIENAEKLKNVKLYEVNYHKKLDLEKEMEQILSEDKNSISLFKAFCNKRDSFEHEKEIRLLADIETPNSDSIEYISFKEIEGFIKSVMLHPLAPNWFNDTLKEFCKINNLQYIGKSELYTFNL
jgi:hypothetical protein